MPKKRNSKANPTISEVTRRRIVEYLSLGPRWAGDLEEHEFLGRIYPLNDMPSTDHRRQFNNANKDIWQHRVMNTDWSDNWVFTDSRFDLLFGPDEPFLKFLAETVHPVVRPETSQARQMVEEYNSHLSADGWELYVERTLSERPVFGFRELYDGSHPHLDKAKEVAAKLSGAYLVQQVKRLESAVEKDPELAIGTAKEFVEGLCKTILSERGVDFAKDEDFPALVKMTIRSLQVVPTELAKQDGTERIITTLLNNLGSIANQLAQLRNMYGTGHGKQVSHVGLEKRHAKLALGVATTLGQFLYDSHNPTMEMMQRIHVDEEDE